MVNINLAAESSSYGTNSSARSYNKGLIALFFVMILMLAGYFWIIWMQKSTLSQLEGTKTAYKSEYDKFMGNKEIMDFQNRIALAEGFLDQKATGYLSLPAIEKSALSGAYLMSFDFDYAKKSIKIEGVADNFDILAKQVLSFKQSDFFSEVNAGDTKLDDKGKVDFVLTLKIK